VCSWVDRLLYGVLGTGFIFAMTTLGSAAVFLLRDGLMLRWESALLGFAAGVMTAASVWSLLLPAIDRTAQQGILPPWFPAAIGIVAGMVFSGALEALICRREQAVTSRGLLLWAITLHNIPEGMVVGLAFAMAQDAPELWTAAALTLGIGVQNFPEGAAVSLPLRRQGYSRWHAFRSGALSGIVEPIFGLSVMACSGTTAVLMPWLLSFAAGAMLYAVVTELIPAANGRRGVVGFCIGFLMMLILDVALG